MCGVQRSAGQTARNNYREESGSEDDLVPKRQHRPRPALLPGQPGPSGPRGMLGQQQQLDRRQGAAQELGRRRVATRAARVDTASEEEEEEEEARRVSSRGRVRRPNPRLLD